MSIVVFDGKTLAADKQCTVNGTRVKTTKIWRLKTSEIAAIVGDADYGLALLHWYKTGAMLSDWPETQKGENNAVLIIASIGRVFHYERTPFSINTESDFHAWGSGRDIALGALAMGADARKAVEIVCRLDNGCGLGIDAFDLEEL